MIRRGFRLTAAAALFALLSPSCAHHGETLPADVDAELDRHEARSFCERWRALDASADPALALKRAELALAFHRVRLQEGSCLTSSQLCEQALEAAESAARGLPQSPEAWLVLGECRQRFAHDRAGAAEAVCRAADLAPDLGQLSEGCGDLLHALGRPAEAVERWRTAVRLGGEDDQRCLLLDKLSAEGADEGAWLETLPPAIVRRWARCKRAQADQLRREREERAARRDHGAAEPSATEAFNERVRERMREMREEEASGW